MGYQSNQQRTVAVARFEPKIFAFVPDKTYERLATLTETSLFMRSKKIKLKKYPNEI